MTADSDFVVYVTYAGPASARFDRAYYTARHLELVRDAWSELGLVSVEAFYPPPSHDGTLAICECRFTDRAAFERCLGAEQTAAVMADVANFTEITPKMLQAAALS